MEEINQIDLILKGSINLKVLGTTTSIPFDYKEKMEKIIGEDIFRNEFRIICKCKGFNDANRKCNNAGLGQKIFSKSYTSETGNEIELKLCETEDIWIAKTNSNKKYVSISQLNSLEV